MPELRRSTSRLIGEVASMRFVIDLAYPQVPPQAHPPVDDPASIRTAEGTLAVRLEEKRPDLELLIDREVGKYLGRDFAVEPIIMRTSSIEILVLVTTISYILRDYSGFLDNLARAVESTRRVLRDYITPLLRHPDYAPMQMMVRGEWYPGTGLEQVDSTSRVEAEPGSYAPANQPPPWRVDFTLALLFASFVVQLALLALVIVLVARH